MTVKKILIVDDSPTDRKFLLEALSKAGYQCVIAENGGETIAGAMQNQARSATGVAGSMQDILRITQQTTDGTKLTATSVGQLATLAKELKGSVSRFRME
ncbi:MAG: hypothetical protein A2W04_06930 [Betaproteobacteria bacterium RBG_16_64_9]|nr:MAG: hypothetical protein A2W04_06930 [Betaproteobacteria bacterium RBG_16_64_9]